MNRPLDTDAVREIARSILANEPSEGDPQVAHEVYRLTEAVLVLAQVVVELPRWLAP